MELLPLVKAFFKDPDYLYLAGKLVKIKFGKRTPMFGAVDINNICNLKCKHCYWWVNRKEIPELTTEQWREVIRNTFKKFHIFQVYVAGGEPTLRPDILEVFNEELPNKFCVVTNATFPLRFYDGLIAYYVSVDGPEDVHNSIRGPMYKTTRENVKQFVEKYSRKKMRVSMSVNALNYKYVEDVVREWIDYALEMAFQLHSPFSLSDPLWIPYGKERDWVIDKIIELRKEYRGFIMNQKRQMEMLRKPWGGVGTTPVRCPTWAILTLDHLGRIKKPCCIGSGDENSMIKPICERCGLPIYSGLLSMGISS